MNLGMGKGALLHTTRVIFTPQHIRFTELCALNVCIPELCRVAVFPQEHGVVRLSATFLILKFCSLLWNTHSVFLRRKLRDILECFIDAERSIVPSSNFGKTVTLDQFFC